MWYKMRREPSENVELYFSLVLLENSHGQENHSLTFVFQKMAYCRQPPFPIILDNTGGLISCLYLTKPYIDYKLPFFA